ncbi:MAG: WhiB family transcriptional regulator [Candidatus Saccharimonadales bacterium]
MSGEIASFFDYNEPDSGSTFIDTSMSPRKASLETRSEADLALELYREIMGEITSQESSIPADWLIQAKCKGLDPSVFHPEPNEERKRQKAISYCSQCVVKAECLEYALNVKEKHGIWGGKTASQRRQIQKQRRLNNLSGN